MRRIFSGVIGDRGIEPGRAVLGGVAALPESAMLDPAGQMLCNGSECRMREARRVGLCLGVGWKIEVYACECCRGDNSRKAPTSSETETKNRVILVAIVFSTLQSPLTAVPFTLFQ
jgi:hypothetical protein